MSSKTATIVLGTDWVAAGQIASLAVHQSAIEDMAIGDFDRDHMSPGSSLVSIQSTAPASPKTGEVWLDTSTTPSTLRQYTGSQWAALGVDYSSAAPSTTTVGTLWYDGTLDLLRRYETIDTITGWHPVDSGFQLMHNRSGGSLSAGDVVVRDTTGTSNREFTTTTIVKDQSVIGVLLEDTDDDAAGVVALVQSGATVDILVDDGEADGAVSKGHGLVTYSVAGESRTVGDLPTESQTIQGGTPDQYYLNGIPQGCYAEALGSKDSNNKVRARLIGAVGSGCMVLKEDGGASHTISTAGAWEEVDLSATKMTAEHLPLKAIQVLATLRGTAATGDIDIDGEISADRGGDELHFTSLYANTTGTGSSIWQTQDVLWIPTNAGSGASYLGPGSLFQAQVVETTGTLTSLIFRARGYIY